MMQSLESRRSIYLELAVMWLLTLLAIRVVVSVVNAGLPELLLAIVPVLFLYVPVFVCWLRGVDSYSYPLYLPRFSDRDAWVEAVRWNVVFVGVITVPYLVGYHLWTTVAMGQGYVGLWPSEPIKLVGYHLFFVAIPEEFFYRGYLQSRLDEAWGTPWKVLGAKVGWGWLITCVIFAFGHSIVQFQWWHVFIVFPSLVFGWMRARTGGVICGSLCHAWSNITVSTLDTLYGIVPP